MLPCLADSSGPEPLEAAGLPPRQQFDVVVSNILRGPLLDLRPRLTTYAAPGAQLLLSGVLETQVRASCLLYLLPSCWPAPEGSLLTQRSASLKGLAAGPAAKPRQKRSCCSAACLRARCAFSPSCRYVIL